MSNRKRSGKGWAFAAGLGALLAFGGLASAGQLGGGGSGGGGSGGGSGGGGSGGGGSGGGGSDPWTPGPGGKGKVYGGAGGGGGTKGLPGDFDFSGNGLWISPECDGVVEGSKFRPSPEEDFVNAIEPTEWSGYEPGKEVEAALAVDPANSIAGFVDWAMGQELDPPPATFAVWVEMHYEARGLPRPLPSSVRIVAVMLRQLSPLCLDVPDPGLSWGEGLVRWLEDFLLWLDLYLHEWWSDSIAFDLGEE